MIDHVTVAVYDLMESKIFYEKIFTPFGYKLSFGNEGEYWAFDINNGAFFEIAQFKEAGKLTPCHVAFRAKSQEQVQQFHAFALAASGKCNGPPGLRPQYTESYYSAFILDPSGHNIEAVFDYKNPSI